MLSLTTVAAEPEHRCFIPELDGNITMAMFNNSGIEDWIPRDSNGVFEKCLMFTEPGGNETMHCNQWVFDDTYYGDTRVTEWNMVCGDRWRRSISQSTYMLGEFM